MKLSLFLAAALAASVAHAQPPVSIVGDANGIVVAYPNGAPTVPPVVQFEQTLHGRGISYVLINYPEQPLDVIVLTDSSVDVVCATSDEQSIDIGSIRVSGEQEVKSCD